MARLFIAVETPPTVQQALAAVRARFEAAQAPRLRWMRPDGIHLTLKFLGKTPLAQRPAIEQAMHETARLTPVMEFQLGDCELFGGRHPLVLWTALHGPLATLAESVGHLDAALAACGFALETRPFTPHLTLARVPNTASEADRLNMRDLVARLAADSPASREKITLPVAQWSLIRSALTPQGALYETLDRASCQGSRRF